METRPRGQGGLPGGAAERRDEDGQRRGKVHISPFVSLQGVCASESVSPPPSLPPSPAGTSLLRAAAKPPQGGRQQRCCCWWGALAIQPAGNMATGGYRSSGGSTTDFLEEWKAKREKMRAKQAPPAPGSVAGGEARPSGAAASTELNNNLPSGGPAAPPDRTAPPAGGAVNCVGLSSAALGRAAPNKEQPPALAGVRGAEPASKPPPAAAPGSPEGDEKLAAKGKSSGPSARKGKGQIEKRKLREKRRSTGVVNIPAAESLDEYEDDEAGQKERKKEDAITQQNTIQNESSSADNPGSYLLQDSSRMVSSRYKSTTNAPEDDAPNRYSRTDRATYSRYSRDANSSGSSIPTNALEKRIEELERELAEERQENARLVKMTQDKDELIGKLKEEIDLLNSDLDDIEDENEQLKQENKTLLKVVGQLTR
ncbi:PRKC apoptosis WT1 regulator protein isoform X2 [Pezoporus occidentalis]|uniref:PRKC apoptosis WT1 regulator protein isoform X1 n=2 Tax=Pezoporus occidentalis TaxID=407982 RepID=UPI002F90F496